MIKCDNCGTRISLETLRCPTCNQVNLVAKEHFEELAIYNDKYKKALSSLHRYTAEYRGYITRILLCGLLVFLTFFAFLFSKSPDDMIEDLFVPANEKYIATHNAVKDDLLAKGDYLKYHTYQSNGEKRLHDDYDHYVIDSAVNSYFMAYETVNSLAYYVHYGASTLTSATDSISSRASSLSQYLQSLKQDQKVLSVFDEAYQNNTEVDREKLESIRPAFSNMNSPSKEALALQIQACSEMETRIYELLAYKLQLDSAQIEEIKKMEQTECALAIERYAREAMKDD